MKASEFDNSKYMNAVNAQENVGKTLTIYEVKMEIVRDNQKMVIEFESIERPLIANKTNRTSLIYAFGDDTEEWIGKKVVLRVGEAEFDGRVVPSIKLEPVTNKPSFPSRTNAPTSLSARIDASTHALNKERADAAKKPKK